MGFIPEENNTKREDEDSKKLVHALELMVILATILIPTVLALANISINIEATSNLGSPNSFGSTAICNSHQNISAYYSCKLKILDHSYLPQYNFLGLIVFLSVLLVAIIIFLLAIYQHFEKYKKILMITGILIIILLSILIEAIILYSEAFTKTIGTEVFSLSSTLILLVFLSYVVLMSTNIFTGLNIIRKTKKDLNLGILNMVGWKGYFARFNKADLKLILGIMLFFIGAAFAYLSISTVENFFTLTVSGKVEYYLLAYNALYLFAGALFLALSVIFIGRKIDLTPVKDLERQISDKFTYLPIYCIENFNLSLEHIERELKNPGLVTWHSRDVLKAILKADINRMPNKEEVSKIIDQFSNEFDEITIELYKNYKIAYEKLENLTENDKILMLGLYNTLLGCNRINWPNIYNTIQENHDLSEKYDSLAKQLDNIEELQNYKKLVEEALGMKEEYKKRLDGIY